MRIAPTFLTLTVLGAPLLALDKQQTTQEMLSLAQQARALKSQPNSAALVERLEARYQRLSASLGGDDPAALLDRAAPVPAGPHAFVVGPPPSGCTSTTTNFANSTSAPILDLTTVTSTIVVSGVSSSLWDVDLSLNINHTYAADLDITLTAPNGTVIPITTDNGGGNDDVFAGTRFDDQSVNPVSDYVFTNLVVAPNLSPEGALSLLRGINPNGTWTLTVTDDANIDTGTLNGWSLDVSDLSGTPSPASTSVTNSTPLAIADVATQSSSITVSGATGSLLGLRLTTFIQHTYAADLDITLTSPAGTVVTITTDNGGGNDDVFNGTVWRDDAPATATDYVYTNLVVAPALVGEGHMDRFVGENPNGVWTLTITDDLGGDVGTLNSWSLDIQSGSCGGTLPPVAYCNPGVGGVIPCPCGNAPAGLGRGCDNSAATGGAAIAASGTNSLAGDTLVFSTAGEKPTATSIVLSGTAPVVAGVTFGQGVRCVGGALKRLYVKTAVAGSISAPAGADPSVSLQHANLGDPIVAGSHRYYMVYYRDPIVLGGCAANSTFNSTNALDVQWAP